MSSAQSEACRITLASRGNILFNRQIAPEYFNAPASASGKVFYKTDTSEYRSVGPHAKRLIPMLSQDNESWSAYRSYRKHRRFGHLAMGSAYVSLGSWFLISFNNAWNNPGLGPAAFFQLNSLPFLAGWIGLFYASQELNLTSGSKLGLSVAYYNRSVCGLPDVGGGR